MGKSNIEASSSLVKRLINTNPELKEQFNGYAGAGVTALSLCSSAGAGEEGIRALMIMGATLYREWLLSRGINLKEVEGKLCNG